MEHFCNEMKRQICVDYENEEVQDIIKAVDILMNRFLDEFKKKHPEVKIEKLLLCGSVPEKTRVWNLDGTDLEFDYLAVMRSWPGCRGFRFEHSLCGQMAVKHTVSIEQSGIEEYVSLDPEVKVAFTQMLNECLTIICNGQFCALRFKGNLPADLNGCHFCSVHMKTGTLKCVNFNSAPNGFLEKFKFVWTSKGNSIGIPNAHTLLSSCREYYTNSENAVAEKSYEPFVLDNRSNQYTAFQFEVNVDLHPAIELDIRDVYRSFGLIRLYDQIYFMLPNYCWYFNQIIAKLKQAPLKEQNLANFVLCLLFKASKFTVSHTPGLFKNESYLLFPKRNHHAICSWRISTCQAEVNILRTTSDEHRLAYCILKFLLIALPEFRSDHTLPIIYPYEAKVAVIRHITNCKTPTIGAHVCLLDILHSISLYIVSSSMSHPFLHLNLYEMISSENNVYTSLRERNTLLKSISLKVLTLVLSSQTQEFTIADLMNDLVSIATINDTTNFRLRQFTHSGVRRNHDDTKEVVFELRRFVQNRKKNSSRNVILKLIKARIRKYLLWNIQDSLFQQNLASFRIQ